MRTRIHVQINLRRTRNRRSEDILCRAQQVLISFRSYLIAEEEEENLAAENTFTRIGRVLMPWLVRKE